MYDTIYSIYDILNSKKDYYNESNYILQKYHKIKNQYPENILDIGCGTGNHLQEFSKHIKHGVGLDISSKMIEIAKQKKINNIEFYASKIQDTDLNQNFELVTLLFQVVNHIDSIFELQELFYYISNKMNKDSILVFDMFNIVAMILDNPKKECRTIDDKITVDIDPHFNSLDSKLTLNYSINNNNKETKYTLNETIWSTNIIKKILESYDFNILEINNNWKDIPADANSYKLLFICQKL